MPGKKEVIFKIKIQSSFTKILNGIGLKRNASVWL